MRSTTVSGHGSASGPRAEWGSKLGFILAAAGSAIGLGNIWRFPYVTGANGGGLFVLTYLLCIAFVGIPILAAEVLVGRAGRSSPVGAFRTLAGKRSPWIFFGALGVFIPTIILSYYSVVAGWCLDYVALSVSGGLQREASEIPGLFGQLYASPGRNLFWHLLFMGLTFAIVVGGVRGGVERAAKFLMPALFLMLVALFVQAMTLSGFGEGLAFVFSPVQENFSASGVLEALGMAFFSLSLGMGAMLTYGSYLSNRESLPSSIASIGVLDTCVAVGACLVIFPITFSFGLETTAGPGLVFQTLPVAFAQMPLGSLWAAIFFLLLFFAALTSAISLLEVSTAFLIDEWGLSRKGAALLTTLVVFSLGVPSALSGGGGLFGAVLAEASGRSWFDWVDFVASNILLPVSGLGIAAFVSWRLDDELRRSAFTLGTTHARIATFYRAWLLLLRYLAPVAIVLIVLQGLGAI